MKNISREHVKQAANNYRESLRKNIQRRLEVARANGDETLISQIKAELDYLKLN
ncbi:MAG: hypothetical protein WA865_16080 [Spirulinaceae cyanobacterium]